MRLKTIDTLLDLGYTISNNSCHMQGSWVRIPREQVTVNAERTPRILKISHYIIWEGGGSDEAKSGYLPTMLSFCFLCLKQVIISNMIQNM